MRNTGETNGPSKTLIQVDSLRHSKKKTSVSGENLSVQSVKSQSAEPKPELPQKKRGRPRYEAKVGVDALRSHKPFELSLKEHKGTGAKNAPKSPSKPEAAVEPTAEVPVEKLPFGWKLEGSHIDLPDGRQIIMDADTGAVAIIITKQALAHGNLAEMELVKKALEPTQNETFLAQEFSEFHSGYISFALEQLQNDHNQAK